MNKLLPILAALALLASFSFAQKGKGKPQFDSDVKRIEQDVKSLPRDSSGRVKQGELPKNACKLVCKNGELVEVGNCSLSSMPDVVESCGK